MKCNNDTVSAFEQIQVRIAIFIWIFKYIFWSSIRDKW